MSGRIIGVDPGGQATGIVVMEFPDTYLWAKVVQRRPDRGRNADTLTPYLEEIIGALAAAETFFPKTGETPPIAIEDVVDPNPHLGITAVRGIIDTAQVVGLLRYRYRKSAVLVRPRGHGSLPLSAYPHQLVGPTERKGEGVLRHARSAWDVARLGHQLLRRNQLLAQQGVEP